MEFGQFIGTFILGRIFSPVYKKAAEEMCQECEPFIEKGDKILDLGCGRGITAETLGDYFQTDVFGVDIEDQRIVDLPFQVIDGRNLPLQDNSFDVVVISYVLHHAENPRDLLVEAKRVAKDKIIIYEDLEEKGATQITCWIHKNIYKISAPFQENPIKFYKEEEWEELFNQLGLKILFKRRKAGRFNWLYPTKNILFVLTRGV
jgi:ubiquinone/menaquinone biosynthesis C-methylase UbiE